MMINLDRRPKLEHARLAFHGSGPDRYIVPGFWFVHFYLYHAQLWVNDEPFEVVPGCITVLPPGAIMRYQFPNDDNRHVYFRMKQAPEGPHDLPVMIRPGAEFASLHRQAESVVGYARWSMSRAEIKVWDMLWQLYELSSLKENQNPVVDRALSWIELNLSEPSVMPAICAALQISYSRLNTLFKERLGTTFGAYVRNRRMEHAMYLLKQSTMSVKEIAGNCGYGDLQQFNKLVRKHTGLPPRSHRG